MDLLNTTDSPPAPSNDYKKEFKKTISKLQLYFNISCVTFKKTTSKHQLYFSISCVTFKKTSPKHQLYFNISCVTFKKTASEHVYTQQAVQHSRLCELALQPMLEEWVLDDSWYLACLRCSVSGQTYSANNNRHTWLLHSIYLDLK